jgi:ferredoxin-type protein NapH
MKRQRIRKAIIFISFLFFPLTIYYFSPALIIKGARLGIVTGSFVLFGSLFFISLKFGRAFCGWVCPAAGLSEACFMAQDKTAKGGKYNWIKYFIWVPWIGVITLFAIRAGGYHSIDPFLHTQYGISVSNPLDYIPFYVVVGLVIVLSLAAGKRGFCHYICWIAPFMVIGRKLRNVFKWPALHLEANEEECIDCKRCSKNCPMSLDVNSMVHHGKMEHSECILCGTCVDVCPKGVIKFAH